MVIGGSPPEVWVPVGRTAATTGRVDGEDTEVGPAGMGVGDDSAARRHRLHKPIASTPTANRVILAAGGTLRVTAHRGASTGGTEHFPGLKSCSRAGGSSKTV